MEPRAYLDHLKQQTEALHGQGLFKRERIIEGPQGAEIRVHDPIVASDPSLPRDIMLTSSLLKAVQGADLVILVSDHPEYRNLTQQDLGGTPVYDGRGILDTSKFAEGGFASIGKPS